MPGSEKALIARIRGRVRPGKPVAAGIGDDCAVLRIPPGHQVLVTTDFSLEGVHFRRAWHTPEATGHRCLARGLSDIAAMGGEPIAAFLSLAVPRGLRQRWVDGFFRGLLRLADAFTVTLAGGDTAESPAGILADIIVVGSLPRAQAILRSGARSGDRIYVTGELGGAAAAINLLLGGRRLNPTQYPAHFHPMPRVAVGRMLREKRIASAMIDLSDGLSTDLGHICEESAVGAEILAETIPLAAIGKPAREVPLKSALHGGEDYELLFTAPPAKPVPSRIAGVKVTEIGRITQRRRIVLIEARGSRSVLQPQGWEHFKS